MRSEPVRIYEEDDARVPRRLADRLRTRIGEITDTVMAGNLPHDEYQRLTGEVAGLRHALQIAQDIAKELSDAR